MPYINVQIISGESREQKRELVKQMTCTLVDVLGKKVYFNFDCVILDICEVRIGDFVFIAPGVHIYAATHPRESDLRRTQEIGKPVTIGNDVWIGGKAIICTGVTIGDRSVNGAGSIVTKGVPCGVVVAGNPAKVIRETSC